MRHLSNINFKIAGMIFISIFVGGLLCGDAYAACTDDNIPCVEVSFGAPQGNLSVRPGLSYYASTKFYLPVEIGLKNVSLYTVKVYGSGSSLVSETDSIPSIGVDTSYEQLGQNGSEWGIRWSLGDDVNDQDTNYHKVPASSNDDKSVVVENQYLPKSTTTTKKQLTLGFAVAVDANQPSGDYTNTVTVAVVASPREVRSIFDISTMQEMSPDICANTTTPAKTATALFDTNAKHVGDTSYVPEVTLTDVRDSKTYLVRKLADGNCWMSQNLSLVLDAGTTLTNNDTDLNSKVSWAPVRSTETSPGATWGANDNIVHSLSEGWSQYWAGGSTFNATGATAQGGTAGYAQRGNYYNWFAATAGSGKSTDIDTTTDGNRIVNGIAQDSICPKGWTLPVGGVTAINSTDGSIKSFYNLVQVYTGKVTGDHFPGDVSTLYASPMSFVPAGYYTNNTITSAGARQMYWTGTAYDRDIAAWFMHIYNGAVAPGSYNNVGGAKGGDGLSVRCVSR